MLDVGATHYLPSSPPRVPPQADKPGSPRGPYSPIRAARRYVSPRSRPIIPEEAEARQIAYALKRAEEAEARGQLFFLTL